MQVLENALAMARNHDCIGRKEPRPQVKVSDEDSDIPVITKHDLRAVIEFRKTFENYVKER